MLPKVIIGVVLLIVAVMTFGFFTKDKFGNSDKAPFGLDKYFPSRDFFADTANMPSCGDKQELFTQSPLALSDFTTITPLGNLGPTGHTLPTAHLYWKVRLQQPGNDASLPASVEVIAPADLKITSIKWLEAKNKPELNDGALFFGVCREFKAYFDHVKTFSDKIKKAYEDNPFKACNEYTLTYPFGKVDYNLCVAKVDLDIKKGEIIGSAGGGEGQRLLDFGALDSRISPHKLANPKRWEDRLQWQYLVCPLDYFPQTLSTEFKSRLGGYDRQGNNVKSPSCGEVMQDIPGTAMGAWIFPGGEEVIVTETTSLALVHENIEPQYLTISMADSGVKAGLPPGKYTFLPKDQDQINRHFKDITSDGKVYCFETEENYYNKPPVKVNILIDMPTPEKLRIQKLNAESCGSGSWKLDNFAEFIR